MYLLVFASRTVESGLAQTLTNKLIVEVRVLDELHGVIPNTKRVHITIPTFLELAKLASIVIVTSAYVVILFWNRKAMTILAFVSKAQIIRFDIALTACHSLRAIAYVADFLAGTRSSITWVWLTIVSWYSFVAERACETIGTCTLNYWAIWC